MTVTAEGPIVDTKTSTIDSKIDQDLLEKLPTSRDAFLDLALTTPAWPPGRGRPPRPRSSRAPPPTQRDERERVPHQRRRRHQPRGGSFGSLVNVNYDTVEEVRIVALGSRAEYGSFSGAAIDVLTKSGSNAYHGSAAFYSKLGTSPATSPRPDEDLGAPFLHVNEGDVLAGDIKTDWEGSGTVGGPIVKDKLWFFGAFDYTRGTSVPPLSSLNSESWGRYADLKLSAAPFTRPSRLRRLPLREQRRQRLELGHLPGWDTIDDVRLQDEEQHRVGAVAVVRRPQDDRSAPSGSGFWTNDTPYVPSDAPNHPGYINWWKWTDAYGSYGINGAFPYVEAYTRAATPIQADVSHYAEGFLGEHDLKFGVQYTKGREQLPGRLLPELRQLPLPVPLDPERPVHAVLVRRHGAAVLQPEGHDQPLPHRAHRRLHWAPSSTTSGRPTSA